ncbi:MAG: peptidylprolyl isomerase [Polyangiaceae bacterium]|nr:peptidylprolyl isomerase [Polyangiaceae bacterium]
MRRLLLATTVLTVLIACRAPAPAAAGGPTGGPTPVAAEPLGARATATTSPTPPVAPRASTPVAPRASAADPAPPPVTAAPPSSFVTALPAPLAAAPAAAAVPADLLAPDKATLRAPDKFQVRFVTTKGEFVLEAVRAWAPHGVDRFYNLVKLGFYNDVALFRVIKQPDATNDFVVQFGIHGVPAVAEKWERATIPDDPVAQSNLAGFASFAATGEPNSRATQIFVNYGPNQGLDRAHFAPFARLVTGMPVLRSLYGGYGEEPTRDQLQARRQGNAFWRARFPLLDFVTSAALVGTAAAATAKGP